MTAQAKEQTQMIGQYVNMWICDQYVFPNLSKWIVHDFNCRTERVIFK